MARLPAKRAVGILFLMVAVLFLFPGCLDKRVSLQVYEVNREESFNQLTVGVRRVFYRPEFDASRPIAPNRSPDLVLLEGYLCNYASTPVRIYNLVNNSEGRQRFTSFRWGEEEDEQVTALFVGGGGSRVEQPTSPRLRQTAYIEDTSGAHYFEVPANAERQFTIRGSHRRLDSSDSKGVLELRRVRFTDEEVPSVYQIEVPLAQSTTVKVFPRSEDVHYPVFSRGDPEPQCSPSP